MGLLVSLEFTEGECKVVLADQAKSGRISVKSLSSFELPKPDDAAARVNERAQALRNHFKAQSISARHAVIVIPKNFVMARTVTLPSTVDDEIAGMARFEADRHIPFNAERHIVSYHVLAKQGMQGSDVLLAAVDQPIAQEYLDVCVKAGLTVTGVTVSSLAMFNAFAVAEKTALADRTVMVVNVGRGATDLVIATNGNVTFTRGSTTGVSKLLADLTSAMDKSLTTADLANMDALEPQLYFTGKPTQPEVVPGVYDVIPGQEQEEDVAALGGGFTVIPPPPSAALSKDNPGAVIFSDWLNKLLQELKRTYEFASREFNCPMINHIYLCGEGSLIRHISQYFQANFNIDAAVFDPLHTLDVASKIKKQGIAPQTYAVAVGGAIGRQPHTVHINLVPGSYTEARSAKRQQRSYIVSGILAFIALIAGYVFLAHTFTTKRELFEALQKENRTDKARVTDLKMKKDRLRIIRENVQDDKGARAVLEILSEKEYIPEQLTLTSFDYKRGDYVNLAGDAIDLKSANQLVNDLRNTGFFATAQLGETVPNKTLRNRPPTPVLGWTASFTFPKPEVKKPKRSASTANNEEEGLDGAE